MNNLENVTNQFEVWVNKLDAYSIYDGCTAEQTVQDLISGRKCDE